MAAELWAALWAGGERMGMRQVPPRGRRPFPGRGAGRVALIGSLWASSLGAQTTTPPQFEPPDLRSLLSAEVDAVSDLQLEEHAEWLEANSEDHLEFDGMVFRGIYERPEDATPRYRCTGGDTALFTGFRLAAVTYQLRAMQRREDLERVLRTLQGLHILTHISGTPGVLARVAIPVAEHETFRYPWAWGSRLFAKDDDRRRELYGRPGPYVYVSGDDVRNVLHEHGIELEGAVQAPCYAPRIFYTRTSRDQLTGVLFGLAVATTELQPAQLPKELREDVRKARSIAEGILEDLFLLLEERGRPDPDAYRSQIEWGPAPRLKDLPFLIRDHLGHAGSAGRVEPLLRTALFGAYLAVLGRRVDRGELEESSHRLAEVREAYASARGYFGPLNLDFLVHPLCRSYFPWNLRWARGYSLYLVDPDPEHRAQLLEYVESTLWCHNRKDGNSFFAMLYNVIGAPNDEQIAEALHGLRSLCVRQNPVTGSLRSYSSPLFGEEDCEVLPPHLRRPGGYFLWQKEPDDPSGGDHRDLEGLEEGTGLDFLLPYWLGRAQGLIPDPRSSARRPVSRARIPGNLSPSGL